jgi:enolase
MKCLQVAGDDVLMSDPECIKRAVSEYTCNALVLKASIKSSIQILPYWG